MPRRYPNAFRGRAVRLVAESLDDHGAEWWAIRQGETRLEAGPETVRKWVRQAEVNAGLRPGVTQSENAQIRRFKKEAVEPRRANEILRTASAFSQRSSTDPQRYNRTRGCIS